MADNTTLPGVGDVYGSDDISGVKYQRIKLIHGLDGTNDGDVSSANGLPVVAKGGFVSTDNSSTSTLAGDAIFTGTGEDITHFGTVKVSWNSDVASAKLGMSMQFSPDGTNWDRKIPVSSHSDALQVNHGGIHKLVKGGKFFRIVYTNGSDAQTFFRLEVIYDNDAQLPLISRIEQQLNTSSDCILFRPITSVELDLARQQITGQRTFFFFGFNDNVGTSWIDIHPTGGDINWLTSAGAVGISSSDAADTSAGLGTRSVEVHGLSATGVDQDEIVTLNGTTEVDTSLSYVRVNHLHNETVGTYGGSHQGDITARVTSGGAKTGAILSVMTGMEGSVDTSVQYGSGEAGNGYYSIPLGKVAYLTGGSVNINTTGTKTADVVLYEREDILDVATPFSPRRVIWNAIEVQGRIPIEFNSHIKIKSLADIWFRAQASNTNTKIEVLLEFYLLDANSSGA